jgi:hypothetical protein
MRSDGVIKGGHSLDAYGRRCQSEPKAQLALRALRRLSNEAQEDGGSLVERRREPGGVGDGAPGT